MLKILKIDEDKYRKIFVISDIHGHGNLFERLIKKLEYTAEDLFIINGDSCDRGEEIKKTYELIFKLKKEANLIHIKGNHEKMLEDFYIFNEEYPYRYRGNGSDPTINEFSKNPQLLNNVLDFIDEMPYIAESQNYIFVHAGLDFSLSLEEQDEEYIVWTTDKFWQKNSERNKTVIFGHKIQKYGCIKDYGKYNCIGVDCGSFFFKRLGCIELKSKIETYVSEE